MVRVRADRPRRARGHVLDLDHVHPAISTSYASHVTYASPMRSPYHRPGRVLAAGRRRTVLLLAATLLALVLTVYGNGAQQAEPPAASSLPPAGVLAATSSSAPVEPASDPSPSQAPPPDVHLTIGYAGDVCPTCRSWTTPPAGRGTLAA